MTDQALRLHAWSISTSKLTSDTIWLPTLNLKRLLRDLRKVKVKPICIRVREDRCVAYIRSEEVFAANDWLFYELIDGQKCPR